MRRFHSMVTGGSSSNGRTGSPVLLILLVRKLSLFDVSTLCTVSINSQSFSYTVDLTFVIDKWKKNS